jgi:type IV pilus assembly protein PilC
MALIFTPGQLAQRAEFYHQLGQLTGAGLTLIAGLEQIKRSPPARSYREPIRLLIEHLNHGYTLIESVQNLGSWLPAFDLALLHSGEQSGRLEACFRVLSDYYRDRARLARQVIGDLAYPVFLFHFAVFILPFAQFFNSGNWLVYLAQTFGLLIPLYVIAVLAIYAGQSRHGEQWRGWLEALLHPIPVLGTARYYLAIARLAGALEALLSAGVTIIEAWELAASASGSPALRRVVLAWRPKVNGGQSPAEVVNSSGRFPDVFASQYTTGEISGKLEETLQRLHKYYQEEGSRKLHHLAQWTPRAVFLLVALMIAYRIVGFWLGHFRDIQNAIGP